MHEILISRDHHLGLATARKLAFRWAETAEEKLGMECTYEEGRTSDLVTFKRAGAHGELKVTKDRFDLHAKLGILLGAFRDRIEGEIVRNLDELLAHPEPLKAFDDGLTRHGHGKKAAPAKKAAARKKA